MTWSLATLAETMETLWPFGRLLLLHITAGIREMVSPPPPVYGTENSYSTQKSTAHKLYTSLDGPPSSVAALTKVQYWHHTNKVLLFLWFKVHSRERSSRGWRGRSTAQEKFALPHIGYRQNVKNCFRWTTCVQWWKCRQWPKCGHVVAVEMIQLINIINHSFNFVCIWR